MITQIKLKNINSISDATINFEKNRYHYLCDNIYNDVLVNPIAFYGTNGSGKTSIIKAIAQLVQILINEPGKYSMFIPNLLKSRYEDSAMTIWFTLDDSKYIYHINTHFSNGIINESLILNDKLILEKKDSLAYLYKGKVEELKAATYSILRNAASNLQDNDVVNAYNFLKSIAYVDASKKHFLYKELTQKSIDDLMVEQSEEVSNILKNYNRFPMYSYNSLNKEDGSKNYYIGISVDDKIQNLHNSFMSNGMYNQSVLLSILTTLPSNSVFIIDEIEDALHPFTILDFIDIVKRKNIQLIFTSHNTFILQKLRPDQIFFSYWNNGISNYKKLSDIYSNIREVNNIEKMYLSHMFDEDIESSE